MKIYIICDPLCQKTLTHTYSNMSNQTKDKKLHSRNYHHLYSASFDFGGHTSVDKQDAKDLQALLDEAIPNAYIHRIFSNKFSIEYENRDERFLVIVGKLVFIGDKNENLTDITSRVARFTKNTLFNGKVWTNQNGIIVTIPPCKITTLNGEFLDILSISDTDKKCTLENFTEKLIYCCDRWDEMLKEINAENTENADGVYV